MTSVGHRLHPHTADLVLEVWGPTREAALAEAVRALAATYAAPRGEARQEVRFTVRGATDADLLVALLDETVYLSDTRGLVPIDAVVTTPADGADGLKGSFMAAMVDDVEAVGPAPKAVARSDLVAGPDDGGWRGRVTIDV